MIEYTTSWFKLAVFELSKITPFFQVKVRGKKKYNRKKFGKLLYKYCNQDGKKRIIKIVQNYERPRANIYVLAVYTLPTWYKEKGKNLSDISENIFNRTNEIIIINDASEYIFSYSSDKKLQDLIDHIMKIHFCKLDIDIKKIYNLINGDELKIRTMGLVNTFGAGGTAVESKSYSGKDTRYSLTPSFDAGYSFNFCIASSESSELGSSVGCSAKKRKVWSGWCKGISEFNKKCEVLTEILNDDLDFSLPILVCPVEPPSDPLNILSLYIDYVVRDKGNLYFNINGVNVIDWFIERVNSNKFKIGNSHSNFILNIVLNDNIPEFSLDNTSDEVKVFFSDKPDNTTRKRKTDFIEYLSDTANYTLLFDNAYAYRDGSHWFDNRLRCPFTEGIDSAIPWSSVDIKSEAQAPRPPYTKNISDATLDYMYSLITQEDVLAIIEDNGANEIADHIVICTNKIILSHEKYSSNRQQGLRVDDLQVVVAQAIKNMKYFFPLSYSDKKERLFSNAKYLDLSIKDADQLYEKILCSLESLSAMNEVWIVQPGISNSRLRANPNNKINILLSYVNSISKTNNSMFKLFCNT